MSVKNINWIKNNQNEVTLDSGNVPKMKELLNKTGEGFCLAKFSQATLHLGSGTVHSCHHPKVHSIPMSELENNSSTFFNTPHLKTVRKEMLDGKRPSECDYCWRIEDAGGDSDRIYKSIEPWAINSHDDVLLKGADVDYYPTYLEVDFSNVCNFACTYCGPEFSSTWATQLKHSGPIRVLQGTPNEQWVQGGQANLNNLVFKHREHNPYIDAFWKWFPEAYKHLKVYRITGGEPLLSEETFNSINWLIENPNTDLEFSINSNIGAPDKIWDRFIEKITLLVSKRSVKRFTLFTSIDGWGKQAEYGRPGLDFELFKKRYEQVANIGNVRISIMCAFNIFSITTIKQLLEWQLEMKKKYNNNNVGSNLERETDFIMVSSNPYYKRQLKNIDHASVIGIDTPYVRSPTMLDAQIADRKLIQDYLIPALDFMAQNTCQYGWNPHQGFEQYEMEKFKRVVTTLMYICSKSEKNNSKNLLMDRAKFYDYVNEIDKRHSRNFLEYFPEMTDFYNLCKEANEAVRSS